MEITPTAANVRSTSASSRTRPSSAGSRRPPGSSPPWCRRGGRPPRPCWIWPSSGSTPFRQAAAPRAGAHVQNLEDVFDQLQELSCPATPSVPGWPPAFGDLDWTITGFTGSELIPPGRPARHGQKLLCPERASYHAGKFSGKSVVFFSLENEPGAAGHPPDLREAFLDNKKAHDRQALPDDGTK